MGSGAPSDVTMACKCLYSSRVLYSFVGYVLRYMFYRQNLSAPRPELGKCLLTSDKPSPTGRNRSPRSCLLSYPSASGSKRIPYPCSPLPSPFAPCMEVHAPGISAAPFSSVSLSTPRPSRLMQWAPESVPELVHHASPNRLARREADWYHQQRLLRLVSFPHPWVQRKTLLTPLRPLHHLRVCVSHQPARAENEPDSLDRLRLRSPSRVPPPPPSLLNPICHLVHPHWL